ncbi:MAG: HDOD domain-containing protein, partial [Methyloprofundus sp.]|nr:HDOD domain-containing protein [Methyloprofundus sp.]
MADTRVTLTAESLVQGSITLFSLPDIYHQIEKMVNDPRFTALEIGQVITKDPALSIRLLKLVNSSFYGFQSRIDTISRAVAIIGIKDLQNLIVATSVVDVFNGIPCDLVDMTDFWMQSDDATPPLQLATPGIVALEALDPESASNLPTLQVTLNIRAGEDL